MTDKEQKNIEVIGGITADIEGNPFGQLIPGDSNPGRIRISYGGVGRNITENLARLGASVSFISAAGDDFVGRGAVSELAALGADVSQIHLIKGENTSMYISILNILGDMEIGLCNMDVLERISKDVIQGAFHRLQEACIVCLDTNLTEETLDYITDKLKDVPLFLDPVSVSKAVRARNIIGRFHSIKPNRIEAQAISGLQILSSEDLSAAGQWFIEKGVKRVFITLGAGGVYYREGDVEGVIRPGITEIVSATGAGDAFSAAILHGFIKGLDVVATAQYGMAAAEVAMESGKAVNPEMSTDAIRKKLEV